MGLFDKKQAKKVKKKVLKKDQISNALNALEEQLREEIRAVGRQRFTSIINENAVQFKQDLDISVAQINADLKMYMTRRIDLVANRINSELSRQLSERLSEYDRQTKDAQDMAVQSLNRNAHALHDKYQQLSQSLHQVVADQEAMMITVFEENKSRFNEAQNSQEATLRSLEQNVGSTQDEFNQLIDKLKNMANEQESMMNQVLRDNTDRLNATKDAQNAAISSIQRSVDALEEQSKNLSTTLDSSIKKQKDIMTEAFQENMARIIEHYVMESAGDAFKIDDQIPAIIQQLEENKQAITDDMKL